MTKLNVEFKDKKAFGEYGIVGGAFFVEQGTQNLYVVVEVLNEEDNVSQDPFIRSLQTGQDAFKYNLVNISNGKMFSVQNRSKYQLYKKMLRHVFAPVDSMKISIDK